jgi:hypothetical protein
MDRGNLESAAANHTYLRGLYHLPLGALCIIAALGNWEWGPLVHAWVFVAAAAVVGLVCLLIWRYYRENYGRLSPSTRQQARGAAAIVIGLAVVIGGSMLLIALDPPVNATAITFALVMLVYYGFGMGIKPHHAIVWGALLIAGALPLWTGEDPSNIGLVMAGVALMANGVLDHRLFVRTFGPPKLAALQDGDVRA